MFINTLAEFILKTREREPTSPQGLGGVVKRTHHKAQVT